MKLEFFPLNSFTRWIISQELVPGFRTKYKFTSANNMRFGGMWNGLKDEEILEKMEMWKNPKESFAEMCKFR